MHGMFLVKSSLQTFSHLIWIPRQLNHWIKVKTPDFPNRDVGYLVNQKKLAVQQCKLVKKVHALRMYQHFAIRIAYLTLFKI